MSALSLRDTPNTVGENGLVSMGSALTDRRISG
jgi:hypothetical protein